MSRSEYNSHTIIRARKLPEMLLKCFELFELMVRNGQPAQLSMSFWVE